MFGSHFFWGSTTSQEWSKLGSAHTHTHTHMHAHRRAHVHTSPSLRASLDTSWHVSPHTQTHLNTRDKNHALRFWRQMHQLKKKNLSLPSDRDRVEGRRCPSGADYILIGCHHWTLSLPVMIREGQGSKCACQAHHSGKCHKEREGEEEGRGGERRGERRDGEIRLI